MFEKLIAQIVEETVKVTLQNLSVSKQESGNDTMDAKQLTKYINMSVPWIYLYTTKSEYYTIFED